jgi:hypothetical protein
MWLFPMVRNVYTLHNWYEQMLDGSLILVYIMSF